MKELCELALVMYKKMNEAFAKYNTHSNHANVNRGYSPKTVETIEYLCDRTLADTLIQQMKIRPEGQKLDWLWQRTLSQPKCVAFSSLPLIEARHESDLVQAIIRFGGQEVMHVIMSG